jgi:tetratricopeptide (TPR) repeat protein
MKIAAEGPEWAIPHVALAEIYYTTGDWSAAEAQLEWLAHHGVDQPRVALIAAGIALVRRDVQSALKEVEFARDVEPELASVQMMLGTVLFRLGRWDDAEDAFREAVRQDPRDARSRDGLATVALHHGEFEDALDWALRALEQEPGLFSAHYHLGLALMWLNQPEEAIAALETAARIDAHRAAPFYWLTRIARGQLGDFARASKYSEQARQIIQRRPNNSRSTISSK